MLSLHILTLTKPPPAEAEKGLAFQPIFPGKSPPEDVEGETLQRFSEDEVYQTTIQSVHPVI